MNKPNQFCLDKIPDGSAKRLMLSSLKDDEVNNMTFRFAPIAFLASKSGTLTELNDLLNMFDIGKEGTQEFKNKLSEKMWIEKVNQFQQNLDTNKVKLINKISKSSPMSSLSELAVAKYIKEETPHEVIGLSATSLIPISDVVTKEANIEVKYFPREPELKKAVLDNLSGKHAAIWLDENSMINYFYIRISEAAMQLAKQPERLKVVWLVFNLTASDNKEDFEELGLSLQDWRPRLDDLLNGLFKNDLQRRREKIKSKKPCDWLKEIDYLVLSTLNRSWSLSDVAVVKNGSLSLHKPKAFLYQ